MRQRFDAKDVSFVTVNVDEKEDVPRALDFLAKQKANFDHYHLDEPAEVIDKELGSTALPTVLVFGKDGKRAKVFKPDEPFELSDVEKFVASLLK
jgi:hypothetical protein